MLKVGNGLGNYIINWADYFYGFNPETRESFKVSNLLAKSGEDIHTIISKNGMRLPLDYERLVLTRNGGRVNDNVLKEIITKYQGVKLTIPVNRLLLMDFYGITDKEYFSLISEFDETYISKRLLPIGCANSGEKFLMNVENNKNNGQIFVELEEEYLDENFERIIVKIADSFTGFLNLIQWENEEQTETII